MQLEKVPGGWRIRLRYGATLRDRFLIVAKSETAAQAKAARMAKIAAKMASRSGREREAKALLVEAAKAGTESGLAEVEAYAQRLCAESSASGPKGPRTFGDVAELWLSGDLRKSYPERVRERTPDTIRKDAQRFRVVGQVLGHLPVTAVTMADARKAMALVPSGNKQGTRSLYERFIYRVMKLARFPLELIESSPIPPEFVSPQGASPLFQFLRPAEELKLIMHRDIPLETRLAYAIMTREGLRPGGIAIVKWSHIDLESGLFSHKHKTARPRRWRLAPDVLRCLNAWRLRYADSEFVLPQYDCRNIATRLRQHLLDAGVNRPALFARSADERPLRAHDLRATFVTLALARTGLNQSEQWVMDRTGHADSRTLNLYRRMAREAEDLELSWLAPLDEALGKELGLGPSVGKASKKSERKAQVVTTDYSPHTPVAKLLQPKTASASEEPTPIGPPGPAPLSGMGQVAPAVGQGDAHLEVAVRLAAEAGEWEVVAKLSAELSARRVATTVPPAGVTSLDAARQRKGGV